MGKGLTSLLSCKYPKTSSFRAGTGDDTGMIYKTMNSVYLDNIYSEEEEEQEEETETESTSSIDEPEETLIETLVVHHLHSDRLSFEPSSTSCSILETNPTKDSIGDIKEKKEGDIKEKKEGDMEPFKESLIMAMESTDPYNDFRSSMEEMVVAYKLTDWTRLEELLVWYLRVNGKRNHAFIIGAFVDLLVGLVPEESTSSSSCITCEEIGSSES